jgi:hypothetical protein
MGFAAIVAGREVAVGDTWQWRGDLLNIQDCGDLVATCKLEEIVDHDGEKCARVVGSISNWPKGYAPEFRSELFFSLDRGLPVSATFQFRSPARTEVIKTRLTEFEPPAAAATADGEK